jgi:glutathione synthase
MEFLAPIRDQVFVVNDVTGQILGNSKLYTLNFPDIIPSTHVSKDPGRLVKIIESFGGAMVVKPLQRFGGEGVIKVSTRDRINLKSLIHYYIRAFQPYEQREPIMFQQYIETVEREGDVQILLLNGEILGAMRRRAKNGDFQTDFQASARICKHTITAEEENICHTIKEKLIDDGLYFVGIDIIGGKLTKINCASPGGIPCINRLDGVQIENRVIDFVEREIQSRKKLNHKIKAC